MPRWPQHKIILPDGDIPLTLQYFSTAGQHWAEYCAASITVSWRGKNRGSSASGSLIDTRPPRPFRASPADLDGPQRER